MTAPPAKAIFSAALRPRGISSEPLEPVVSAALAVRTFAAVAMIMPNQPASAESRAPATKQPKLRAPSVTSSLAEYGSRLKMMSSATETTSTKMLRYLYSSLRKAFAPACTMSEISFIFAFPRGWLITRWVRKYAMMSASTEHASGITPTM